MGLLTSPQHTKHNLSQQTIPKINMQSEITLSPNYRGATLCSNNTAIPPVIATYTFFNPISLSKGRHAPSRDGKILYKGLLPCTKKTKRTIPSLQLLIVRLETQYIHDESSTNPVSKKTNYSTFRHRNKLHACIAIAPPPRHSKGFSDYKDFLQSAKFFSCQRTNKYI